MFSKLSKIEFAWNDAIRATLCMLPMAVAYFTGYDSLVVPFGQGGFFYSMMPLPETTVGRILNPFTILGIGMGFYLVGGNIAHNFWLSLFLTFTISVSAGLISGYKLLAPLAFTFITLYSAGLNASTAERAHDNFLAFVVIFLWCGIISLPSIWKGISLENLKVLDPEENYLTGVRLGIGTVIALAFANIFGFVKYGWPVSAVGTIGGACLALATFFLISTSGVLIMFGCLYGILQALFSKTMIGRTVFFLYGNHHCLVFFKRYQSG
jgi:hypothetical protein